MSSEWKKVKIGDLGKVVTGKTPSTSITENFGGDYPFITIPDLNGRREITSSARTLSEVGANSLRTCKLPRKAVMMSCIATIGKCGITTKDSFTNQQINSLICKDSVDPNFVYYSFKMLGGELEAAGGGGSVYTNVSKSKFESIEINLPSLDKQKSIASLLMGFDDKIELNNQIIQTLEAMAQAIFKSWFVDFEPVKAKISVLQAGGSQAEAELAAMMAISGKTAEQLSTMRTTQLEAYQQLTQTAALFPAAMEDSELGEIPEGWTVASLSDVCEFQNGFAFQSQDLSKEPDESYRVFKMGDIKKGGGLHKDSTKDWYPKYKSLKLSRYILKKGDLLMCMTDMKNNVALLGHTALMDVDDEYILNQRVGLLRPKDKSKANYPFLYILTNSSFFIDDIRSRANSGVQVNLSTKGIKETRFVLPNENVHGAFDKVALEIQEQIFSLQLENVSLKEIRDSLLPKLLSGEIDLSQLEEAA